MMPFSVLISLYGRERPEYLRACLESLCAQTLPADEVVLVFDGALSEDLEAAVSDFQAALPLNIVRLPENVGLGRALDAGLRHCSHEWVFRMDSDDICLPQRFAEQCAYLAAHPDIRLLGAQIEEFDGNPGQARSLRRVPCDDAAIRRFAQWRNPFNHMTAAYTRSAVASAGGYRHHPYMEDYNLWLRMLASGVRAANSDSVLVRARAGTAMMARRRGWHYVQSEWQLFRLKRQLRFQAALPALYCFALRALPRLLPAALLEKLYRIVRRT